MQTFLNNFPLRFTVLWHSVEYTRGVCVVFKEHNARIENGIGLGTPTAPASQVWGYIYGLLQSFCAHYIQVTLFFTHPVARVTTPFRKKIIENQVKSADLGQTVSLRTEVNGLGLIPRNKKIYSKANK